MKLSEEELDNWFIELPLFLKRIVFQRLKGFIEFNISELEWEDVFKG